MSKKERILTPNEALVFLNDQLNDEICRGEAYRAAAIALIDHAASDAVLLGQESRKRRRDTEAAMTAAATGPISTATN